MKLRIKVTKEILERSKFCGDNITNKRIDISKNCAIALAVRDIFPNAVVGSKLIDLDRLDYKFNTTIILPEIATEFIELFDHNTAEQRIKMPEFSFEIEVPQQVIDQIGISEVERILSNSSTLELVTS